MNSRDVAARVTTRRRTRSSSGCISQRGSVRHRSHSWISRYRTRRRRLAILGPEPISLDDPDPISSQPPRLQAAPCEGAAQPCRTSLRSFCPVLSGEPGVVGDDLKANPRPVLDVLQDALQWSQATDEAAKMVCLGPRRLSDQCPLDLSDLFCLRLIEEETRCC